MRKDQKNKKDSNWKNKKQENKRKNRRKTKKSDRKPAKRTIKDCVFTDLFSMPENLLALYQALHPEDKDATMEDLRDITINNVLVDDIYNDLGFRVGNHLIILVEAQSTWSENIIVRSLLYLADTYQQYINENHLDVYHTTKIPLPRPELYVIFTGERKEHPAEISLKEIFFPEEETAIDVKVKVLYGTDGQDVISQYVTFTKVFDEQRRLYGRTLKAVTETIRICKDKNILRKYLESREKEVITMLMTLYDDEQIMKNHDASLAREITEKGIKLLIETCQPVGITFTAVVEKVQNGYNLTETEATALVKKFWKPEPVAKH